METIYRDTQVNIMSKRLNISKGVIKNVITEYVNSLVEKLEEGYPVKFLGVCYLKQEGVTERYSETLAYSCTEIGKKLNMSSSSVLSILSVYEDILISDLRKFYTYSIRGLVNISVTEYKPNEFKLRIKKATNLANKGIRVVTMNSFRRKVGVYDR